MSSTVPAGTEWRIVGEEAGSCNGDWGCPCQFNALPTDGTCEALISMEIIAGNFGDLRLDGVKYAQILHWDGPVHHGNGWRQLVVDNRASPEQVSAIEGLTGGRHGHPVFEIFSAMAPNAYDTIVAPVEIERDIDARHARIRIPGLAESDIEPIRNPVTGDEHRARIDLPNGFEYRVAEVGTARDGRQRLASTS